MLFLESAKWLASCLSPEDQTTYFNMALKVFSTFFIRHTWQTFSSHVNFISIIIIILITLSIVFFIITILMSHSKEQHNRRKKKTENIPFFFFFFFSTPSVAHELLRSDDYSNDTVWSNWVHYKLVWMELCTQSPTLMSPDNVLASEWNIIMNSRMWWWPLHKVDKIYNGRGPFLKINAHGRCRVLNVPSSE